MAVRRETLCSGGPRSCNEATIITCKQCGEQWKPEDIRDPGECPTCGAKDRYERERCPGCDVTKLELAMQTPAGVLLSHVATIDGLRSHGFSVGLEDVTAEEVRALEILWAERDKYQDEKERQREQAQSWRNSRQ